MARAERYVGTTPVLKLFAPILLLVTMLAASSAGAYYRELSPAGSPTCPKKGQFFQDHFCWMGVKENLGPACVPCLEGRTDFKASRVLRGGQPSPAGVESLKRIGVRLLIDLRSGRETEDGIEEAAARANGIVYFNLPMKTSGQDASAQDEQMLFRALGLIRYFLLENADGLVYFHCQRGEDRTGLVAAGYQLLLEGFDRDAVKLEMHRHYFNQKYASLRTIWESLAPTNSTRVTEPSDEDKARFRPPVTDGGDDQTPMPAPTNDGGSSPNAPATTGENAPSQPTTKALLCSARPS